jgi:hypothetical protein
MPNNLGNSSDYEALGGAGFPARHVLRRTLLLSGLLGLAYKDARGGREFSSRQIWRPTGWTDAGTLGECNQPMVYYGPRKTGIQSVLNRILERNRGIILAQVDLLEEIRRRA